MGSRIENIKEKIPLAELLSFYGYEVDSFSEREQQFPCDLHGDGSDGKPSARYYPGSTNWHCWACGKNRDAIDTVMDREGLDFNQACSLLERKYKISYTPVDPNKNLKNLLSPKEKPFVTPESVDALLRSLTEDRSFTLEKTLKLWEIFDKLAFLYRKELISEEVFTKSLADFKSKIIEAFKTS